VKKTVLITGANGEIGHGLIDHLADTDGVEIVAMDINPIDDELRKKCSQTYVGDILKASLLENLSSASDFDVIYHLAALLSTRAERQPPLAHRVNVDGTLNILELAVTQSRLQGREIKVLYPSTIAVHGLPDLATKNSLPRVKEDEWCTPRTMYGINKLYCEQLGYYYSKFYRQLDAAPAAGGVDFRCLRFPGLISASTVPTGGTSDYGPEMLHAAAVGTSYACFVREDTRIPFMAMPDAVQALLHLEAAPRENLRRQVYNVAAFNPSAADFSDIVTKAFPDARITFSVDEKRQALVDSWPSDVDTTAATRDWNWKPEYSIGRAFDEYLIPAIRQRYRGPSQT